MHGFTSQQSIDRYAIKAGQFLEFIDPHTAGAFFNGHKGRARGFNRLCRFVLSNIRILAGNAQASTYLLCAEFI